MTKTRIRTIFPATIHRRYRKVSLSRVADDFENQSFGVTSKSWQCYLSMSNQTWISHQHTYTRARAHSRTQRRLTHTSAHTYALSHSHSYTLARGPILIHTRVLSVARARTHRPTVHTPTHVRGRANWLLSSLRLVRCELFVVLPLQVSPLP